MVPSGNVSIRAFTVFSPRASHRSASLPPGVYAVSPPPQGMRKSVQPPHTVFRIRHRRRNQRLSAKSVITGIMPSGVSSVPREWPDGTVCPCPPTLVGIEQSEQPAMHLQTVHTGTAHPAPPSAPTTRSHTWFSIATAASGHGCFSRYGGIPPSGSVLLTTPGLTGHQRVREKPFRTAIPRRCRSISPSQASVKAVPAHGASHTPSDGQDTHPHHFILTEELHHPGVGVVFIKAVLRASSTVSRICSRRSAVRPSGPPVSPHTQRRQTPRHPAAGLLFIQVFHPGQKINNGRARM